MRGNGNSPASSEPLRGSIQEGRNEEQLQNSSFATTASPLVDQAPAPKAMEEDLTGFNIWFAATQIFGVLSVILVAVWTTKYGGGFAWTSNPSLEFNWHVLLMTVGFIFLYGNSILIYRSLRGRRKPQLKLIHAFIPVATLVCIIIGQIAVFDSHNLASPPVPNLYSLHSWIGLAAIILYFVQWIMGLVVFLYPGVSAPLRSKIMPWHLFFGIGIFILVICAALSGLTEKAIFKLSQTYGERVPEGVLINFIGIAFTLFAGCVIYIVTNPSYKRYPRPEDGALLNKTSPSD